MSSLRPVPLVRLLAPLGLLALAGCQAVGSVVDVTPDSLLQAGQPSPRAVTLDIYWVRCEADSAEVNQELWRGVQEDRLPLAVRQQLAADGLRAGIVGAAATDLLLQLLAPQGGAAEGADKAASEGLANLQQQDQITRRLLQLRPGRRAEIQVSTETSGIHLFRRIRGELTGQSYQQAQGMYAIEVTDTQAGRVDLTLTPELHHGEPHMQYTPSGPGMIVQQMTRDIERFTDLQMAVSLTPGEVLVVTCTPEVGNRLGRYFHRTAESDGSRQKLLLVRLSRVPPSERLAQQTEPMGPWR